MPETAVAGCLEGHRAAALCMVATGFADGRMTLEARLVANCTAVRGKPDAGLNERFQKEALRKRAPRFGAAR